MYQNNTGSLKMIHNKGAIAATLTAAILVVASLALIACAGAGSYRVQANAQQFKVVSLIINPASVGPGEQAVATASIANTGSSDGQYNAVLKIDDIVQEVAGLNVPAGGNQIIQFSITRNMPQIYKIGVGEQTALLTVNPQAQAAGPALANAPGNLPPCCQTGSTGGQPQVSAPSNLPPCCQTGAPGASQGTVVPRRGCCQ